MKTNDLIKEFASNFQDCQIQRHFNSLLIEITVGNDVRELDVKSCSQLLTVETVKVKPHVWLLYLSYGLTVVLYNFTRTYSLILLFLIQILSRLYSAVVESCFLRRMSSESPIQGFIQKILMSTALKIRLIEFPNSIFTNFILKHDNIEFAFKIN